MHVFSTFLVCYFFIQLIKKKISTNGTMFNCGANGNECSFWFEFSVSCDRYEQSSLDMVHMYIVGNNSARTLPTIQSNVNNISFKECSAYCDIPKPHSPSLSISLVPFVFLFLWKLHAKNIVTVPLWPQITERWGMYWVIEIASETKPTLDVSNQQRLQWKYMYRYCAVSFAH